VTERRVSFRHPLIRSAVYGAAPFAERRDVHEALALALADEERADRRAWHRAAARAAPDAEVADELERTADVARQRGGPAAAAAALERAAELTPDEHDRWRRLLAAAEAAWAGGKPERALTLLDRLGAALSDVAIRAEAEQLRGMIELRRGSPAAAYELLVSAAELFAPDDPERAAVLLTSAAEAAWMQSDPGRMIDAGRRLSEMALPDNSEAALYVHVTSGLRSFLEGDFERGSPLLRDAAEEAASVGDPRHLRWGGFSALQLGDDATAAGLFRRAVAAARERSEIVMLPPTLQTLAMIEMLTGRLGSALGDASEGLELARETGQANVACSLHTMCAWIEAVQGNVDATRAHVDEALAPALARRLVPQASLARWAAGLLDLGEGRGVEALASLEQIEHPVIATLATGDVVEAAVRCGRPEAAQSRFAALEALAHTVRPPWALAIAERCRALLAADTDADRHFSQALTLHLDVDRPIDLARTQLLYGEYLRRVRRRMDARGQLRAALEVFEGLGARLGGAGPPRAARDRRGCPQARPEHARRADPAGATDRPLRR
jgi:tetratricopeptide (TPR) repeat protein